MQQNLEYIFFTAYCVFRVLRLNKLYTKERKKEKQTNSSKKGCLAQDRDSTLFIHHQGEFKNKCGVKTQENVTQVCENGPSCGNDLNS